MIKVQEINVKICNLLVLLMLAGPSLADTGKVTGGKDLLGDPYATFNSLPDSVRNGILMVTGLVFLGALLCVIYAILIGVGKTTVGQTTQDAKIRNEGVSSLIVIAAVVVVAVLVLGFVFWYFKPASV